MRKAEAVIFDMDGTLYNFPGGLSFSSTPFGRQVKQNVQQFIAQTLGIGETEAQTRYAELSEQYDGEMSLAVEQEFGIDRMEYFASTWNIQPERFITPVSNVRQTLESIDAKAILLSSAPRVWVSNALGSMALTDIFGERIYTGESNVRKPNPAIFSKILDDYSLESASVISIGDQEYSDITPARQLGMLTMRIGSNETAADFSATTVVDGIQQLKERGVL